MLDLNPLFTQTPLADHLSGDLAINNSVIYNLLNTSPGEQSRIFRTAIGSHWRGLLHENINDVTAAKIEDLIVDSLKTWAPKIQLIRGRSRVTADFNLPGYRIHLEYTAPNNPLPKQVSFLVPA
jgi:phage baseplate assembly protein W